MKNFDVVVIGGGPGALASGIKLSQAGKMVALIQEERDSIGGICLTRGCMPTKSLLKAATAYRYAKQSENYGLDTSVSPVNLERLRGIADKHIANLGGMAQRKVESAQVTILRGKGSFKTEHEIIICNSEGKTETIRGEKIIIATGSNPAELSFAPFDGQYIYSSDQLLRNTELPAKMLIVGGGAIGCEMATLYNTFGSKIILVEALETLLPHEDQEAGKMLQAAFESQGILVKTGTVIEELKVEEGQVKVKYKDSDSIDTVDKVLVGVGRKPNIEDLNLGSAGVETVRSAIKVNELMQTSVPHIYAVGDAIGGLMLAHAAEKEGELLAENLIHGQNEPLNEIAVPRVAFSHPEVAAVGITSAKTGIKSFTMPRVPNARSVVDMVTAAFVKIFIEEDSGIIVGAIIIGEAATEMIHEMALAVENRLTLEQVGKTVHAHPTHSKNVVYAVRNFN